MGIFSEEPFLATVTPAERDLLRRVGTARAYKPDDVIMRQGDRGGFVVVILSGWTSVSATTDGGRSVIFGLCGPMDLVGELAAFDGKPRSATVTALTEVTARWQPGEEFRALLARNLGIHHAVLRGMAARLRATDEQHEAVATLPVLQRLARLLLDLDGSHPRAQGMPLLTQQEMASAIGATRESVAKVLANLRARKVVRTQGRITVLDRDALRAIAAL